MPHPTTPPDRLGRGGGGTPAPFFASYDGFLVAGLDGVPGGALSGCGPTRKTLGHFVETLAGVLGRNEWGTAHLPLVWQRLEPVVACNSDTPEDRWVEFVALRLEARGKGVAARLLDAILERGQLAGSRAQAT